MFEAIDVQEEHGDTALVTVGQHQRAGHTVGQQEPVWESCQEVMVCEVCHARRQRADGGDVPKQDDFTDHRPEAIADQCGAFLNRALRAVTANQRPLQEGDRAMVRFADTRVDTRRARPTVGKLNHLTKRSADGLGAAPTGDRFGRGIDVDNTAGMVDVHQRFTNRVQRRARPLQFGYLLFVEESSFHYRAPTRAGHWAHSRRCDPVLGGVNTFGITRRSARSPTIRRTRDFVLLERSRLLTTSIIRSSSSYRGCPKEHHRAASDGICSAVVGRVAIRDTADVVIS